MLLNELPPEFNVCVPAEVNVTVFAPGVKVPPVFAQLPETLNVPDGAVSVPLLSVISAVATVPVDPVNVPPEIVRPPLNDWATVEAR